MTTQKKGKLMQGQDDITYAGEPDEEELDMYAELMQDQFMAEGSNLRKIIEPLLCRKFFPFENPCLGSDVLAAYQEERLPSHLAAQVLEHLVCCGICAEDMLFLHDNHLLGYAAT